MIEFSLIDNNLQVIHYDQSPTVYLDHWAFREFADDETLGCCLHGVLLGCVRGGELMPENRTPTLVKEQPAFPGHTKTPFG